jgi:deazaflavin-dependent oxidoreductase (nitroreductase family)
MARRNPAARLRRRLLAIPIAVVGVVAATVLFLFSWGLLLRARWVSDRTRQLAKRGNRYARSIAGTRWGMLYFNLAALHHVGRRSGRPYVTPLSAYPLGDGFVLGVAYPHVDWCENLLAAGKCTLTWNGKEYALERPEVISLAEAEKAYPPLVKFLVAAFGHNKFVWLHRAGSKEGENLADSRAGEYAHN